MFVTWISSMWYPPNFPNGIYVKLISLHTLYVPNACLFCDSYWIFFYSTVYHLTKYFDEFLISKPFFFFCLMAGFEKLNSTKSALREGLSVGNSLNVSFPFHYNLGPLTFWFGWHNSETQVLSFLKFVFILWNFHAVTQCCLIKSIHLYPPPPASCPIVCYPISLPTSCVPFLLLLITPWM